MDDLRTGEPIIEVVAWILFCVITCYGIFAFALPMLRFSFCKKTWRYVAIAIPVIIYSTAAWEIATDTDPMTPVDYVALGLLFIVFTTPAIVFNVLLYRRVAADTDPFPQQVT